MTQRDQVRWQPEKGGQIFDPQWWSFLAAPARRATPDEAQVLHRLAAKAVALAAEYGETLTFAEGLQRARENMAEVRTMALVREVVG